MFSGKGTGRLKALNTYISECRRLLYWSFFKPYSLNRWLTKIAPTLTSNTSISSLSITRLENPKLQRLVGQYWWLSLVSPLLVVGVFGGLSPSLTGLSFDWDRSLQFLLGWSMGIGLFIVTPKFPALFKSMPLILVATMLGGIVSNIIVPSPFSDLAFGVAGGVAFGVAFGVAGGVTMILGALRFYFWAPALLWMGLLFLVRPPNPLKWLPPQIDEKIILPLPFLSFLIADTYPRYPQQTIDTLTYLTTSTNQQTAAARSIALISANILQTCQTLRDIAAIPDQLNWIPSPPPPQAGPALPTLLEISQDVRASQDATTLARQVELLNAPIKALQNLSQSLAYQPARIATRFGPIAAQWLQILQTAQRTLTEQADYAQEIPAAYLAGPVLDPTRSQYRFKGRVDLFGEIEKLTLAQTPPVLLLYGGRRTGKSSTLEHLPTRLPSGLIPLRVDLQGVADASSLLGVAQSLSQFMAEAAARLPRRVTLPYLDSQDLRADPFPALRQWFSQIERQFPNKRFLLCLDEYERLEEVVDSTHSRAPLNFLRHIMQHRPQWILLFSGSHTPNELASYWSDYLINTRSLRVSYLKESEARDLISHPIPDFPDIYAPAASDRILHWTRCQPYLIQLLCSVIVDCLNDPDGRLTTPVTPADIDALVPLALESGGQYFQELWNLTLNETQRQVLTRLLQGGSLTDNDSGALKGLQDKEVLERQGETYVFQAPMVEAYVRDVVGG